MRTMSRTFKIPSADKSDCNNAETSEICRVIFLARSQIWRLLVPLLVHCDQIRSILLVSLYTKHLVANTH